MSGADFLRALLVVAGVVLIGQGLFFIPAAAQLAELTGEGVFGSFVTVGRVLLPLLYGACIVAFSGPLSRLLMPRSASSHASGIAGFTESLVAVAGVVILGLALADLTSVSFQYFVLQTGNELSGRAPADPGWSPWLQPSGRLILGGVLVASRTQFARLFRSPDAPVAG